MKKIAIVFPVFNGLSYTKEGLKNLCSIIGRSSLHIEIVIVDDGSTDGTAAWIKRNYPFVHILTGDGSLWWSGGMNVGMCYAFDLLKVDYIVCWNNDIFANVNYFEILESKINQYGATTLLCSKVLFSNLNNKVFACGCFYDPFTGLIKINGLGQDDESPGLMADRMVDWAGGMGTIISVEIYKQVGLFDNKNFPQYKGDADYCLRVKRKGFKMFVCPDLKIWNSADNTGLNLEKDSLKYLLTSQRSHYNFKIFMRFVLKHGKPSAILIAPLVTYLKLLFSFLKLKLR